jgi:phage tail protein X
MVGLGVATTVTANAGLVAEQPVELTVSVTVMFPPEAPLVTTSVAVP